MLTPKTTMQIFSLRYCQGNHLRWSATASWWNTTFIMTSSYAANPCANTRAVTRPSSYTPLRHYILLALTQRYTPYLRPDSLYVGFVIKTTRRLYPCDSTYTYAWPWGVRVTSRHPSPTSTGGRGRYTKPALDHEHKSTCASPTPAPVADGHPRGHRMRV